MKYQVGVTLILLLAGCLDSTNRPSSDENNDTIESENFGPGALTQGNASLMVRLIGAQDAFGRWNPVVPATGEGASTENCIIFENYSEAIMHTISANVTEANGTTNELETWRLGIGTFFADEFEEVNGSLPLSLTVENISSTLTQDSNDTVIVYVLPGPEERASIDERANLEVFWTSENPEALEIDGGAQCH